MKAYCVIVDMDSVHYYVLGEIDSKDSVMERMAEMNFECDDFEVTEFNGKPDFEWNGTEWYYVNELAGIVFSEDDVDWDKYKEELMDEHDVVEQIG